MSSIWDSIEKQVEDEYPDWYERIEKTLYPLIGESGNRKRTLKRLNDSLKLQRKIYSYFWKKLIEFSLSLV
ncbi:hypothetical protein KEH51_20525 [[Brevibacterium] frigoritolerans]|uniref:Uncharacterized protein n=1 Tax=Peribacillus frigoritolerans TaxID=450367 RepID=A0A941FS25_9BACI|nr:hypothetical protein [Peribacillus frigoritolerans]